MTRFTRTLLAAAIISGTTFASVANVQAGCGGSRRSHGHHYRPRVHHVPRPVYHPPAPPHCTQPVYQQPIGQPVGQPIGQPVGQPIGQPIGQPGGPALQQPGQPLSAQGAQQSAAPAQSANPVASQPAPAQGPSPQAGTTPSASSAQLTALQALAGMSAGAVTTTSTTAPSQQPSQQQASQVGSWTATLSNGARVQLNLQANGTFSWSATNKTGRASSFSGSYTVAGGSLTLVRSKDSQKLAGALTQSGTNAFNFKLAGAKDNGLDFVRS